MNKILSTLAAILLFTAASALAGSSFPSLVGTWDVSAEGAILVHGGIGKDTHWSKGQTRLRARAEITEQNGRVMRGIFISPKGKEPFVAVIGYDNQFHLVDDDGMLDGKIVNKNRIEIVYRHVNAKDSVVAAGVWTRQK